MGAHLHTVYFILYIVWKISVVSTFWQVEESRADNISSRSKQVFAGKLTIVKKLANYARIRATRVKGKIAIRADNGDSMARLRNYDGYSATCDDIKYYRRIGNSRRKIVNLLLSLISEANHPELLQQPTNHFQPSRRYRIVGNFNIFLGITNTRRDSSILHYLTAPTPEQAIRELIDRCG